MRRLLSLLFILCASCAHVEVSRLLKDSDYKQGIRFYRPRPYLARALSDKGCTDTLVWLPDKSQEYVIVAHSGLGSIDSKVSLENGWNLTSYGEVRDSKIPETITALSGLLTAAAGVKAKGTPQTTCLPGLYRFSDDLTHLEFIGPRE